MFVPADNGEWVSEKFERLQRVIQDYDHNLELRWIPPRNRVTPDDTAKPYQIYDTKHHAIVFHASELDSPEEILARLFRADNLQGNVLSTLESHNAAVKALELKERMDEYEEMADQANFLKNSPLHTIRFNGKKFDHARRRIE